MAPYHFDPPIHGGRIRLLNLMRAVIDDGHNVEFWCVGDAPPEYSRLIRVETVNFPNREKQHVGDKIRALLSPLPSWSWLCTRKDVAEQLSQRLQNHVDMVILDELHTFPYAASVPSTIPVLITALNVESEVMTNLAQSATSRFRRLRLGLDAAKLRRMERQMVRKVADIVVVSEDDARHFEAAGARSVTVVRNGVDSERFGSIPDDRSERNFVVMTANFAYGPNESGARWLIDRVLPIIWASDPTVQLALVGSGPPDWMRELAQRDKRVVVTGQVADVGAYLERAMVAVVPLLAGGGTSLKVAEAVAAGLPVVCTTIGGRGYPIAETSLGKVADTPREFAEAIISTMENAGGVEARQARREFARRELDWSQTAVPFLNKLRQIASKVTDLR